MEKKNLFNQELEKDKMDEKETKRAKSVSKSDNESDIQKAKTAPNKSLYRMNFKKLRKRIIFTDKESRKNVKTKPKDSKVKNDQETETPCISFDGSVTDKSQAISKAKTTGIIRRRVLYSKKQLLGNFTTRIFRFYSQSKKKINNLKNLK